MRHLRLAFDERFWEAAEGLLADLPGEEDEGFVEPLSFQDVLQIDPIPGDVSAFFFPDADFHTDSSLPDDSAAEEILRCPEESLDLNTLTDLPTDIVPNGSHFSVDLDYPEFPGVGCSSCAFHRERLNNEDASCALCYMRKTAYAVYGWYSLGWLVFWVLGGIILQVNAYCFHVFLEPVSPAPSDHLDDVDESDEHSSPVTRKRPRHQDTLILFKRQRPQDEPLDLSLPKN